MRNSKTALWSEGLSEANPGETWASSRRFYSTVLSEKEQKQKKPYFRHWSPLEVYVRHYTWPIYFVHYIMSLEKDDQKV